MTFSAAKAFAAKPGEPAPDFTLTDTKGKTHSLKDFAGKYVVLEWTNHQCPFVRKHYGSGNMQKLQKEYTGKGVVWLSIVSSAPGEQGYVTAKQENKLLTKNHAAPTAVLLDPNGTAGQLYGAKTTPDMVVIDPKGTLIYSGAIDDKPSTDKATVAGAHNYVRDALDAAMAGQPVKTPLTKSYGCGIKYKG
jgi:peroxiredoxin